MVEITIIIAYQQKILYILKQKLRITQIGTCTPNPNCGEELNKHEIEELIFFFKTK
jgi:hypothetical protein